MDLRPEKIEADQMADLGTGQEEALVVVVEEAMVEDLEVALEADEAAAEVFQENGK